VSGFLSRDLVSWDDTNMGVDYEGSVVAQKHEEDDCHCLSMAEMPVGNCMERPSGAADSCDMQGQVGVLTTKYCDTRFPSWVDWIPGRP
jgi:hypothetical protein